MPGTVPRPARVSNRAAAVALAGVLAIPVAALAETGTVVRLETENGSASALLDEREAGQPRGAVIVVPGLGRRARAPGIASALRAELPRHGWDVLVLEIRADEESRNGPGHARYLQRVAGVLDAAHRQALERGARAIAVAGYGHGAGAVVLWAAGGTRERLRAVISFDPELPTELRTREAVGERIAGIGVPLLDVHGATASRGARDLVERRFLAARLSVKPYRMVEIATAGIDLLGAGPFAARTVRGWLERVVVRESGA